MSIKVALKSEENSKYPPTMWASKPCSTAKRTNNGPESFHSRFNDQFYSAHPCIFTALKNTS
jgi:hypothetical protein